MDPRGWSSSETRCLISVWAEEEVQRKLVDSYRKPRVFEMISQKMVESGHNRSWQQCQRKIKYLKLAYKRAKDSNGRSGMERVTCPFFDELDEVLKDKPSFCPADGFVLDSADAGMSTETRTDSTDSDATGDATPEENEDTTVESEADAALSQVSSKRKRPTRGRGKKKNTFEKTLEMFANSMNEGNGDEVLLKMQERQHAHKERLFKMMMQSISAMASPVQPSPIRSSPYSWYQPQAPCTSTSYQPQAPSFHHPTGFSPELPHTSEFARCSTPDLSSPRSDEN